MIRPKRDNRLHPIYHPVQFQLWAADAFLVAADQIRRAIRGRLGRFLLIAHRVGYCRAIKRRLSRQKQKWSTVAADHARRKLP